MNTHRLGNIVMSILLTLALAFVLSAAHLLDEEPQLTDAQRDAIAHLQAERVREQAARDLCVAEYGPQTAHHWDSQGALVCISRRGEVLHTAGLK